MTRLDSSLKRLFRDPIKRRAWIKYQIHMTGLSMAQVAAAAGVKRATLYSGFMKPYPRMEKILAEACGLTPQQLFAERYDADGLPMRPRPRPTTQRRRAKKESRKSDTSKEVERNTPQGVRNLNQNEAA
jgi:Ner family transcriptional regulator